LFDYNKDISFDGINLLITTIADRIKESIQTQSLISIGTIIDVISRDIDNKRQTTTLRIPPFINPHTFLMDVARKEARDLKIVDLLIIIALSKCHSYEDGNIDFDNPVKSGIVITARSRCMKNASRILEIEDPEPGKPLILTGEEIFDDAKLALDINNPMDMVYADFYITHLDELAISVSQYNRRYNEIRNPNMN